MNLHAEEQRVRSEQRRFGEKYGYPSYDCGTRALAIAANMSYWGAFQLLKGSHTIGRKITKGPINGRWFKGYRPQGCDAGEFAKQHPTGTYIIYCWHYNSSRKPHKYAHHYAVCVDGELGNDAYDDQPVKYAFAC